MKSFSLAVIFFSCLLLTTSCSFGEELEKDTLPQKEDVADEVQYQDEDELGNDDEVIDNIVEFDEEDDVSNNIKVPKIISVVIENITNEENQRVLKLNISLKKGEVSDFDFTYKWFYNDEEIFGEVDNFIAWNDEYKKGDKIRADIIPPNVNEDNFLVINADFIVPNSPPVITSEPPLEIRGDEKLFEYKVEADDPDGDEVEFVLRKSPKGMTIEPATGLIKWDFTEEKPGSEYKIDIVAIDSEDAKYTQEVTLTIPESNPDTKSKPADQEQPSSEDKQPPQ